MSDENDELDECLDQMMNTYESPVLEGHTEKAVSLFTGNVATNVLKPGHKRVQAPLEIPNFRMAFECSPNFPPYPRPVEDSDSDSDERNANELSEGGLGGVVGNTPTFAVPELDLTRALVESSSERSVFAGCTGPVDKSAIEMFPGVEFLIPVRENGVFREGRKKKRATKFVFMHDPKMLSHPYLETHPLGVLHILPGWDHKTFISDVSYRFRSSHTQTRAAIPFLGGIPCTVRTFQCSGVYVCPNSSATFRSSRHVKVHPKDRNILDAVEAFDPMTQAKKRVTGIFLEVKQRTRFCPAKSFQPGVGAVSCAGTAQVVCSTSPLSPNKHFLGCSNYKAGDKGHYARALPFEEALIEYLKKLFSGEESPMSTEGDCTYVQAKNKGKKTCPRHGIQLVEIPCKKHPDDEISNHVMCTIEPNVGFAPDVGLEHRVLYVSCIGEHLHPAPPPPETTVKKMLIFQETLENRGNRSLAQLRKDVQSFLIAEQNNDGRDASQSRYQGSLVLPEGSLRRRLRRLRPKVSRKAAEIGELSVMAADQTKPYVRDMKIVGEHHVFFLALDETLMYASTRMAFAGDATFKTVTDGPEQERWYLYNIVTSASEDRLNEKGIVVMRVLMTGLTKEVYYTIWKYFLESLIRASNVLRGREDLECGTIKVPYLPVAERMMSRACMISSITMDFDAAEVIGCAEALATVVGGSAELHVKGLFVGCSVHLQRDLLRHSRDSEKTRLSGKSSRDLYRIYRSFCDAATPEDAASALTEIKSFDAEWVKWVENQGLAPMISKCLSNMSPEARSLAFADTNVVESHNRRGNALCGTHLPPTVAAEKLFEVDKVDEQTLSGQAFNQLARGRGYRNRSDSILRPGSSSSSTTRKRSRKGAGPSQKRAKKASKSGSTMHHDCESGEGVDKKAGAASRNEGRTPAAVELPIVVHNQVQHMLSQLLLSSGELEGEEGASAENQRKRRTEIFKILRATNDAGSDIGKTKDELLRAMEEFSEDVPFFNSLLKVFTTCLCRPNGSTSDAGKETRRELQD